MIISDLYKVIIDCNKYDVTIDDEVLVTVTVKDFNNQAVTGKNVTLKVDKGYFTQKGNTTVSNTSSIEDTTDNNGKVTAKYKASEWGLVTLEVVNNTKVQLNVTGWRYIYNNKNHQYGFIRTNGEIVHFSLKNKISSAVTLAQGNWSLVGKFINFTGDNEKYKPTYSIRIPYIKNCVLMLRSAIADDIEGDITLGQIVMKGTCFNGSETYPKNSEFVMEGFYPVDK